ncbi:MAG: type II toxin-antitoxin system PemK/MazF family toxin [Phormidesmis sp. CAN_BIN44]|nr:type II toxin-antitoxin system PemK/MazF family toxin [Phormidesmis sp. CAN_BIN44]
MRRGEIWLYNANPTLGDEISKIRPAIIVNNDNIGTLRLKIIVPITGWNEAFSEVPWMVRLDPSPQNQLTKTSAADTFQVRSVSQQRLVRQLGFADEAIMRSMSQALALVLNIDV